MLKAIRKTFVLGLLVAPLLGGCGSSDKFPGSGNNQNPDPLVQDIPLFYIQRPILQDPNNPGQTLPDNIKDPLTFHGGAKLYMKLRAEQSAPTTDLSARAMSGDVDVRDLDVSSDGNSILFSLRAPQLQGVQEQDQPTWNIWEYDTDTDSLYRVIVADAIASEGHDIMARFLPDGRILFASTRQETSRSILLDEGKDSFSFDLERGTRQPALNLHILDPAAQTITQVTFNQSHDMYPVVMPDGKVVFSRWDNYNNNAVSLYEMNPDGTETHILYGHHSQDTGNNASESRFVANNVLPNGSLFSLVRPDKTTFYGGNFMAIDTDHYVDNIVPTAAYPAYTGPAQTPVTDKNVLTDGSISPAGYFSAFVPLRDGTNRAVVSWSQCRVLIGGNSLPCTDANLADPNAVAAPPAYGIWTYDYDNNTQIPVIASQEGVVFTDIALGEPSTKPTVLYDDATLTGNVDGIQREPQSTVNDLHSNGEAIIHIRSVYDVDGIFNALGGNGTNLQDYANPTSADYSTRPARFLRVVKAVSKPPRYIKDIDNTAYGVSSSQGMREIIGYAPIEPDGSVQVKIPANVALALSVVDANGRRISPRHQNWISLRPGEVMECKGCHTPTSTAPHGRYDAQGTSINAGQFETQAYNGTNGLITSPYDSATMAEAHAASDANIMTLSSDLLYSNAWAATPDAPISLKYEDLPEVGQTGGEVSPANSHCNTASTWDAYCRIVINYETNILPIWNLDRGTLPAPILASDAQPATCVRCHSPSYMIANADSNGTPPTQLDLTDNPADANVVQKSSYVDLFNADVAKVVQNGSLVDCTEQVQATDANGNPVFDSMNNPVMVTQTCQPTEGPYLSAAGANSGASVNFFAKFEGTGSHAGYLTPAELRLIAEWLDIGAQYYNNQFDAPNR